MSTIGDLITFAAQKTADLSADRLFWATVTQTSPLRVREDTATENINITPKTLTPLVNGDRVFCLRYGRRLIVLGKMGGQQIPDPVGPAIPTNFTLLNGTENYGRGYQTARFYKTVENVVFLEGFITGSSPGMHVATLPPGHRPRARLYFIAHTGANKFTRVDVTANGEVIVSSTSEASAWLSLSGISFLAER